jgi:hypothetical protein
MSPRIDRFGDPIDDDEEIFSTRTPPSQRAGRRPTVGRRAADPFLSGSDSPSAAAGNHHASEGCP